MQKYNYTTDRAGGDDPAEAHVVHGELLPAAADLLQGQAALHLLQRLGQPGDSVTDVKRAMSSLRSTSWNDPL